VSLTFCNPFRCGSIGASAGAEFPAEPRLPSHPPYYSNVLSEAKLQTVGNNRIASEILPFVFLSFGEQRPLQHFVHGCTGAQKRA